MNGPTSRISTWLIIGGLTIVLVCVGVYVLIPRESAELQAQSESPVTLEPDSPKLTVMAFGDSVTAGYGLALSESYPAQLEQILKDKGYAVRVINAGVSGETTSGGLRRVDFAISQKPDIIILALGGNDVLRGIDPETSQSSLEGMLKAFQNAGISVVLVGMKAPLNLGFKYVNTFNAIYPNLAKTFDVPLVPFLLDGVALDPTLNQSDGIHPNAAGARIVAEKNILPVLLPLLKQAKS